MTDRDIVERLAKRVGEKYVDEARILSFWEFLQEVQKEPYATLRSAAQYLRDMIESYGSTEVDVLGGKVQRHLLFDGVQSDPDAQRVVGTLITLEAADEPVEPRGLGLRGAPLGRLVGLECEDLQS